MIEFTKISSFFRFCGVASSRSDGAIVRLALSFVQLPHGGCCVSCGGLLVVFCFLTLFRWQLRFKVFLHDETNSF